MIVTRFCSKDEYEKFMKGERLINSTDHYKDGKGGSKSKGFCFSKDKPEVVWRYLKGIVDYDVCMVLDIDDGLLTKSYGKYFDYRKYDGLTCLIIEYCTEEYSNKTARIVKVLRPEEFASEAEILALRYYMPMIKQARKANQ